jgi:hypothetical protein
MHERREKEKCSQNPLSYNYLLSEIYYPLVKQSSGGSCCATAAGRLCRRRKGGIYREEARRSSCAKLRTVRTVVAFSFVLGVNMSERTQQIPYWQTFQPFTLSFIESSLLDFKCSTIV